MINLQDAVAVITARTSGIGLALAKSVSARGRRRGQAQPAG